MSAGAEALSPSLENYLEAILMIQRDQAAVRAKDIVERLNVSNSSVTGALQSLAAKDLVNYTPYSFVTLTAVGEHAAEEVAARHEALKRFFTYVLGVAPEEADAGACQMEHGLQPTILSKLVKFVAFVESCPRGGADWLDAFRRYCEPSSVPDGCETCISECLQQARQDGRMGEEGQ